MEFNFISYQGTLPETSHDHAQIVLAIEGSLEIEVGGKGRRLHPDLCAFVPTGTVHSQLADARNRFLVVNCREMELENPFVENLSERVFLPVPSSVKQLIGFAAAARSERIPAGNFYGHWAQLLVNALAASSAALPQSRIVKCMAAVDASLEHPWTVQEMARRAGLSPSRFHAVFFEKMEKTPQSWLTGLRIKRAQQWLAKTDIAIAELALRVGYSDQSALTRAMQRTTGLTPAAYRKQQELRSKEQDQ